MHPNETPAGLIALFSRVDLYKQIRWQSYEEDDRREPTDSVSDAMCASSRLREQPPQPGVLMPDPDDELHHLMIDLDVQSYLVPSTTPGHSHLYVDKQIPWRDLERLLMALSACGIIEEGYANASAARRSTTLRLPWIRKETPPEEGDPMKVKVHRHLNGEARWVSLTIRATNSRWEAVQFIESHEDLSITSELLGHDDRQAQLRIQHAVHGVYLYEYARISTPGEETLETLLDQFKIVEYLDWVKVRKIQSLIVEEGN